MPPPTGYGTTIRTARVGHVCAAAGAASTVSAPSTSASGTSVIEAMASRVDKVCVATYKTRRVKGDMRVCAGMAEKMGTRIDVAAFEPFYGARSGAAVKRISASHCSERLPAMSSGRSRAARSDTWIA